MVRALRSSPHLAPAVLALIAIVAGGLTLQTWTSIGDRPANERGDATAELVTPVLSPRRVPEMLRATVGHARLTATLDATLDDPRLRNAAACLTVESGDEVVYARNPEETLVPASTMKVLTGMAALRRMEDATYRTPLVAGAGPRAGVVDGPVWLVGSGDPLLATEGYAASFRNQPQVYTRLDSLADAVAAKGVREIRGGVIGDESRYDATRYVPSWKPAYLTDNDVGPVSALTVNDGFTQFKPMTRKHAPQPALHAAAVVTQLLRDRGIVVGEPGIGAAPQGVVEIAAVESPPMSEVVAQLLRESDNMTAELLVKELGRRFGAGGSWTAGLDVIRATIEDAGLAAQSYVAVDGSGLDVTDRLSCTLLMDALDLAGPGGAIAAGFPVAGQTGTLAERFKGTAAEGRLRAKTGSLNHVASLAGFVESGAGTLEFALLANALPDQIASGRALQDRVGAALAAFPDVPPVAVLAPSGSRR